MKTRPLKVVLVHEFLTQYGGGERILEQFTQMFPDAPIYTLIYDPLKMKDAFGDRQIISSILQNLPFSKQYYKWHLPLMPWATEHIKLPADVDLVLSDSSAFAKGVNVSKNIPHLCFLHTPTRYLWSVRNEYVRDAPIPFYIRPFVQPVLSWIKRWDYLAAQKPDAYIANSTNVARQMRRYYDRSPEKIIFPFVELKKFALSAKIQDYFLILTRLEPYKRVDLVLEACADLKLPLKVAGNGSMLSEYKTKYRSAPTIEFLGRVSDQALPALYAQARAFIFPGEEDAGITPLEAMAAGRPVIAYGKGGALESILPGITGEFFYEQSAAALKGILNQFDEKRYNQKRIREHVKQFDVSIFTQSVMQIVENLISQQRSKNGS
ncbi:glycosyltransferase [Candidatus Berkelbacteria bacterium]|nr:glycosyltransferase [Candidatus Berkelbacteria bacterium]